MNSSALKTIAIYLGVFGAGLCLFVLFLQASPSPETLIVGEWKELSWSYEKVDQPASDVIDKTISSNVKEAIGNRLVIHQAERWQFFPNGDLLLISDAGERMVKWQIKGRGHILQLVYDKDTAENYVLAELDNGQMNLHFETDVQARGIAKLTFERLN